jgi:hypothetical protein
MVRPWKTLRRSTFRTPGLAVLALGAGLALAPDSLASPDAKTGEIRVFVFDKSGKIPDLATATATITINPKAEKPEKVQLTLHRPATAGATGILPASAQSKDSGDYRVGVDLIVPKPKEGKEEKQEKAEKKESKDELDFPYFKAQVSLEEWTCEKCKGTPAAKPGKCPKCNGDFAARMREFDVAVNVKIGDKTLDVSGIKLKTPAMATPAAGEKPKGN